MSSPTPLHGIELIDCAKANAKQGIMTAADLCGYGQDTQTFKQELQQACQQIGIHITELSDLLTPERLSVEGVEFAPDTETSL